MYDRIQWFFLFLPKSKGDMKENKKESMGTLLWSRRWLVFLEKFTFIYKESQPVIGFNSLYIKQTVSCSK